MESRSVNGILVRLPDERWAHIALEHRELVALRDEVLSTLSAPDRVLEGRSGELLAVAEYLPGKFLVVVYREGEGSGFVVTAFFTRRAASLGRRRQLWPS